MLLLLFLLLLLLLLPNEAIVGLVHGPGLVVLAPIEGIFSNLLSFLSFALLGRYLLPVLILLLFL
jgi:hypothetical protein